MKKNDISYIIKLIILALCLLALHSCKTIDHVDYIPVETVKTEYRDRLVETYDSIHVHDSVFVAVKGDTIYKYKQQLIYKNKFVHDTIYIGIRDSIPVPCPVEKQLTKWEQFKVDYAGWIVLALLIVLACIILLYRLRKT